MMKPFGGPRFHENEKRCGEKGCEPCAFCGKAVKLPVKFWVHVVEGGARFATKAEHDGTEPVEAAADMGCFPVGPDCRKALVKEGVHTFEMEG